MDWAAERVGSNAASLEAVGLAFRAEILRRWRSWLAMALLTSVVGGVVLATAAAGRRTESAFPRFVHAHGFDAWGLHPPAHSRDRHAPRRRRHDAGRRP